MSAKREGISRGVSNAGLAKGTSEAVRLVEQGGVRIDGASVVDSRAAVSTDKGLLLQVGKRFFKRVVSS